MSKLKSAVLYEYLTIAEAVKRFAVYMRKRIALVL